MVRNGEWRQGAAPTCDRAPVGAALVERWRFAGECKERPLSSLGRHLFACLQEHTHVVHEAAGTWPSAHLITGRGAT